MVEQLICNQQVAGSIPIASSVRPSRRQAVPAPCRNRQHATAIRSAHLADGLNGGVPEWPKGTDCKSVVSDFEGSNPSPSTPTHRNPTTFIRGSTPTRNAGVAQLVELQPSKLVVEGSNPFARSSTPGTEESVLAYWDARAKRAKQAARKSTRPRSTVAVHFLGKEGVASSILAEGSAT